MSESGNVVRNISGTLDHLVKEMQEGYFTDNEVSLGTIRVNLQNIQVILKVEANPDNFIDE